MYVYTLTRTSKESNERLTPVDNGLLVSVADGQGDLEGDFQITLKPEVTYQTVLGFGGAFTEATAVTLDRMSPENRQQVLRSYFCPKTGHGYSMGRVHIHSCDFALGNYTYVEEGDESLSTFTIDHDRDLILPLIKDAQAQRGQSIPLLASPWSPPAWMKTNGEMNNGGQLKPEYRETWAAYYAKFLTAYKKEGLNMWGITVQNEPAAVQVWDSCIYTAEEERDFVTRHLGPTLHAAGHEDVRILVWDHNRDIIVERTTPILSDPEAAKYVWGTGFHWYVSEAFENIGQVHDRWPDKHLLFTEGCQEGGVHLNAWHTGERYGRNIMGDLNNWNEGFLDWNLVLDETGGPNHVGNLCDAPIIADTVNDILHYNSSYFYIGHFSRFIKPDAVRIGLQGNAGQTQAIAFRNPDGSMPVVLLNETDHAQEWKVTVDGQGAPVSMPAHSIATLVLNKSA